MAHMMAPNSSYTNTVCKFMKLLSCKWNWNYSVWQLCLVVTIDIVFLVSGTLKLELEKIKLYALQQNRVKRKVVQYIYLSLHFTDHMRTVSSSPGDCCPSEWLDLAPPGPAANWVIVTRLSLGTYLQCRKISLMNKQAEQRLKSRENIQVDQYAHNGWWAQ